MLMAALPRAFAADTAPAYPGKPVRWVVPFVAGGGVDVVARLVAQKLSDTLKQSFVVDNRAGAAGTIGAEIVANAPADGYTLLSVSTTLAVNQALHSKSQLDLTRDFAPITEMTSQPYVYTVHASVPATTIPELIAVAKAKPNSLTYASSGTGGLQHLAGALLCAQAGIQMIHVPYKGGGAAHNDLAAGHIQVEVTLPLTTYQHVKAGRLRYLAVTSLKRLQAFPDLPTVADTLPGYEIVAWYGVVAPAKTPPAVVALLNREIVRIMQMPDVGPKLAADGTEPTATSAAEFRARIARDIVKFREVAQKAGVKIE